MIKTFCNKCGKELIKDDLRSEFHGTFEHDVSISIDKKEVCLDCALLIVFLNLGN